MTFSQKHSHLGRTAFYINIRDYMKTYSGTSLFSITWNVVRSGKWARVCLPNPLSLSCGSAAPFPGGRLFLSACWFLGAVRHTSPPSPEQGMGT